MEKYTLLPSEVITRQCKFNSNEAKGTPLTYIPSPPLWKGLLLSEPEFKEVLRADETIMRDRPGPECFIRCKQVERTEWLPFWDSWGTCLPSTTTLGPEKRDRLRSLESEWTCAAVGQPEWPQVLQSLQTMLCRPGPHTCTQTRAHRTRQRSPSLSYLYSGFVSSNWSWWGTNW